MLLFLGLLIIYFYIDLSIFRFRTLIITLVVLMIAMIIKNTSISINRKKNGMRIYDIIIPLIITMVTAIFIIFIHDGILRKSTVRTLLTINPGGSDFQLDTPNKYFVFTSLDWSSANGKRKYF